MLVVIGVYTEQGIPCSRYLDMGDDEECLAFWYRNKSTLNKLVHPALRALSVPSSAIEEFLVRVVLFYHLIAHACLTAYCLNLYFWSCCCISFTETL